MSRWPIMAVAGVVLAGIFITNHGEMIEEPPTSAREVCDGLMDRSLCQAASYVAKRRAGIIPSVLVADTLPSAMTPGAVDPAITQDNINDTICNPAYLADKRLRPSWVQSAVRRLARRDYPNLPADSFHLDQLVPISLGGAASDGRNLWLQQWGGQDNAASKDALELVLNRMVCAGQVPLASAQQAIARNWIDLKHRVTTISLPRVDLSQMANPMPLDQSPAALPQQMIQQVLPEQPSSDDQQGQRQDQGQAMQQATQQLDQDQPNFEVPAIVPGQF